MINNFIRLTEHEGGKVFVADEQGNVKLVVMSPEFYRQLISKDKLRQLQTDVEEINKKILRAQLQDEQLPKTEHVRQSRIVHGPLAGVVDIPGKPAASFSNQPTFGMQPQVSIDAREEVLDPTFDFDVPTEKF